jgi:hypothetical protein
MSGLTHSKIHLAQNKAQNDIVKNNGIQALNRSNSLLM